MPTSASYIDPIDCTSVIEAGTERTDSYKDVNKNRAAQAWSDSGDTNVTERTIIDDECVGGDDANVNLGEDLPYESFEVRIEDSSLPFAASLSSSSKVPTLTTTAKSSRILHRRTLTPPVKISTITSTIRSAAVLVSHPNHRDNKCELLTTTAPTPLTMNESTTTKYQRRGRFLIWPVQPSQAKLNLGSVQTVE
jgi:hypothetical protein